MADSIPIPIEFTGGEISVEFSEEGVTLPLELSQVGPRLFRIGSVPIMVETVNFGDVIEAEPRADDGLRFVRIAETGGWRTYDFLIPPHLIESQRLAAILSHVLSLGGHWERVFGGVLFLCLPPTTDYDPSEDIQRVP